MPTPPSPTQDSPLDNATWTGPVANRYGIAPVVLASWMVAWFGAQIVATLVVAGFGRSDVDSIPIPMLGLATLASWSVYLAAANLVSRRAGTGNFRADYRIRFTSRDLVGVPIGIAIQLLAVPAIYWPLRAIWTDTFSQQRLQENATDLAERATGASVVVLIAMVVIGAPLVEEIVYRGMLQLPLSTRYPRVAAWLFVVALFTLIHFRPVEYPGLFVFALVVGACTLITGRLGLSIIVHLAFNATGLALAL